MIAWPVSGAGVSTWGGRQPGLATACVHPGRRSGAVIALVVLESQTDKRKPARCRAGFLGSSPSPSDSEGRNGRTLFDDYGVQVAETIFSVFTSKDGPLDADGRGDAGSAGAAAGALSLFLSLSLTVPVTSIV